MKLNKFLKRVNIGQNGTNVLYTSRWDKKIDRA